MHQYLINLAANTEEKLLVARIDELAQKSLQGISGRTGFLDLRQQLLGEAVAVQYADIRWEMDGGFETAERKRLLLAPAWEDNMDNHIQCISIMSTDKKGMSPGHRDYLGAIMNLGVKREKIGDILVQEREAFAMIDQSLTDYLCQQLNRVGHNKVIAEQTNTEYLRLAESEPQQISCTIPSLRLDAVLAAACRISRSEATSLIEAGRVRLNHQIIEKNAASIEAEDLLSVRGQGRIHVDAIEGLSKKGRYRVRLSKW